MLNAFRHHGERDHLTSQPPESTMKKVLNAFRHHGERDLGGELRIYHVKRCSTPSGITASGTYTLMVSAAMGY